MNHNLRIDDFLQGEFSGRYAPRYRNSTIITNAMVGNNFLPVTTQGVVLTKGNLNLFPEAHVVPVIDALSYLGYTRKHIIDLRINKNVNLVAAGMGGINNGIMYWLNRIDEELSVNCTHRISIHAFDSECWDVSNTPRIHFHSLGVDPLLHKAEWVGKVLRREHSMISYNYINENINVSSINDFRTRIPPIVFGATDMTTRELLSKSKDCVHVQITQSDHKLNIHINPAITMKSRDVYGTLYLNEFSMMTLKATVNLLEIVKRHTESSISPSIEEMVELFDIQDHDEMYGLPDWLGVVPKGVSYSRHNGYRDATSSDEPTEGE